MKSALLTGALCLGIGLGVGAFFAGPTPTTTGSGAAGPAAASAPAGSGGDALTRAELAAIVRQELARERGAAPAAAAYGAAEVRHQTLTDDGPVDRDTLAPEVADQAERATQIVTAALQRGSWTEADKVALTQHFEGLPGAVKAEIAGQLAAAVNRGEVRLDLDDLPL